MVGETVHKIFRSAGEMIADGEGAFRAPYIGERSDGLAGLLALLALLKFVKGERVAALGYYL